MPTLPPFKGTHYALIKQKIPPWLSATSTPKAEALRRTVLTVDPWHATTSAELKRANAHAWTTQNTVDKRLQALQDVYGFAEPLLSQALKQQYGFEENVRSTYLLLHTDKGGVVKGVTRRMTSLLDAAIHNFAKDEQFSDSSSYISQPDASGHFSILPLKHRISIKQFTTLCRELDLGARYQAHLNIHLAPADLKSLVIASQQAAFNVAAHLALARQAIDTDSLDLVRRTLAGERGVLHCYQLHMMGGALTGPLLIAADLDSARTVIPVTVYLPHDPFDPLKQYPNIAAFKEALNDRLKAPDYRQYFAQFVDQQQRRRLFTGLAQGQDLRYEVKRIDRDLWASRYEQTLNKIFNDARERVVSTADCDNRKRWAWWDDVSHTLEAILNLALLVITPFVPFLGELMLAYTAYQLLDEVVEGVVDLTQGQAREAAGHFVAVVSDVVQFGIFGAAGEIVPSVFVEQLKPVDVDGHTRLWNPDLRPYAQSTLKPALDSRPDALGLLHQQAKTLLPLEGEHYAVKLDSTDTYRIEHPSRPEAYSPRLRHNGQGAWTHEAEDPRTWSEAALLRRLGHSVSHLSDAQLEQARAISGTDHGTLRALHRENSAPPALLVDTLKRVQLNDQVRDMPRRLREGLAVDQDTYWSPHLITELPGWPADLAIDVYEEASLSGTHIRYGQESAEKNLAISREALNQGTLAERVVNALDERELQALLTPLPTQHNARIEGLRERLAEQLRSRHRAVFDYFYDHSEQLRNAEGLAVRAAAPGVPASCVDTLLAHARPAELTLAREQQQLPLRLKNLARELAIAARSTHAHEGLYLPDLFSADSERLVLSTLKRYSDAFGAVRIEVREQTISGTLRATAGPADAQQVRVLVRDFNGRYAVSEPPRTPLHEATDFYNALLHTLPAARRRELGGSDGLHAWLLERLAPLEERRTALEGPAEPLLESQVLLQRPGVKWVSQLLGLTPRSPRKRLKKLYPALSGELLQAHIRAFETPEGLQALDALEKEKKVLTEDLDNWVRAPTQAHAGDIEARQEERWIRTELRSVLLRTWETTPHGYVDEAGIRQAGSTLNLEGWPLGSHLLRIPTLRAPFEHVTQLQLGATEFGDGQAAFIGLFPNLRALDLTHNQLTRLPDATANLPRLTHLRLGDNPLQWGTRNLDRLQKLSRLKVLDLSNNRNLSAPPNVDAMRDLRSLCLAHTQLTEWPQGLFAHSRPDNFHLDLQDTAIKHVPKFLPWQPQAELVARTRMDRKCLNLDDEERMVSYRLAAGLDPYRHYPPRGLQDSAFWMHEMSAEVREQRQQQWDELELEHGSQGFFEVLRGLQPPNAFETAQDRTDYAVNRAELTRNVWRMLDAVHRDEALRRRFFSMTGDPGNCADASAQIFNILGVQTLVHELYASRGQLSAQAFAERLAQLARQTARLDAVTALAEDEVARRLATPALGGLGQRLSTDMLDGVPGEVDEVQVHAAYQTGLKQRLDLPWLVSHMVYRVAASVDTTQLDTAFQQVLRGEQGDGLVNRMLEVHFWDDYLDATYADELAVNTAHFQERAVQVDELYHDQHAWAHAEGSEKATLRASLEAQADALNIAHDEVFSAGPMRDVARTRMLDRLAYQCQERRRELTRDALGQA